MSTATSCAPNFNTKQIDSSHAKILYTKHKADEINFTIQTFRGYFIFNL